MRAIVSETDDHNLYYTRVDQSPHALHTVDGETLLGDICLLSFFCKHIVLAASHVFECKQICELIQHHPELLEAEVGANGASRGRLHLTLTGEGR